MSSSVPAPAEPQSDRGAKNLNETAKAKPGESWKAGEIHELPHNRLPIVRTSAFPDLGVC